MKLFFTPLKTHLADRWSNQASLTADQYHHHYDLDAENIFIIMIDDNNVSTIIYGLWK